MKNLVLKVMFAALMAISAYIVFGADGLVPPADGGAAVLIAGSLAAIPKFDRASLKVVTPEEFARLEAQYGKIYVIDVPVDEDEHYQFVVRRPTRVLLEAIGSNKDMTKSDDMIIKNMVVAGDTKALDDGVVFAGFNREVSKIINSAKGFLSKA